LENLKINLLKKENYKEKTYKFTQTEYLVVYALPLFLYKNIFIISSWLTIQLTSNEYTEQSEMDLQLKIKLRKSKNFENKIKYMHYLS